MIPPSALVWVFPFGLAAFSLIAFLLLRDRRHKKQLLELQSNRRVAAGDGKDITQEMSSLDPTAPDQIYELGSKTEGIGRVGPFEVEGEIQTHELP